jgi:hypothetical protein
MSDYIGQIGCLVILQIIDVSVRSYSIVFPFSVALLRYLLVVKHEWVNSVGIKKVVNMIIVSSIILPIFMDLSFQFPITDYAHGPFNQCIGRFEVYFNPTHGDPFTPGKTIHL